MPPRQVTPEEAAEAARRLRKIVEALLELRAERMGEMSAAETLVMFPRMVNFVRVTRRAVARWHRKRAILARRVIRIRPTRDGDVVCR
jgi:hypothetical protein